MATGNTAQAEQAIAHLDRILNPASGFEGSVTATGQTLRLTSNQDVKALQLILERGTKLPQGLTPMQTLEHLLKDPETESASPQHQLYDFWIICHLSQADQRDWKSPSCETMKPG